MKTQILYGPETPGYAQLNAKMLSDRTGKSPSPRGKKRTPKSQGDDTKPKQPRQP